MSEIVIGILPLGGVTFPGRAGELQAAGATAALVSELGGNYATYHQYLAGELRAFGKRPDPDDFETRDDYLGAWTRIHDIVRSEAVLRNCRAFVLRGRSLNVPLDPEDGPLVNETEGLLAAVS